MNLYVLSFQLMVLFSVYPFSNAIWNNTSTNVTIWCIQRMFASSSINSCVDWPSATPVESFIVISNPRISSLTIVVISSWLILVLLEPNLFLLKPTQMKSLRFGEFVDLLSFSFWYNFLLQGRGDDKCLSTFFHFNPFPSIELWHLFVNRIGFMIKHE